MYCKYDEPGIIDEVAKSIMDGDLENLRFYLDDGLDPDQRNSHGTPLLICAVNAGKIDAAALLLARGANPDTAVAITNHTPLHYAAREDAPEMINLLLKNGAAIDAVDAYGWTPLHMSADRGTYESLKALIAAGANPLAQDRDGATPRDKALGHYAETREADHWLCGEHLREAERQRGGEDMEHEKAERDIATLKAHNPRRFRLKF